MTDPGSVIDRIRRATNAHDLDALVACFATDIDSRLPCHPARSFRGNAQIRTNWTQIFAAIPDLSSELVSATRAGDTMWCEWHWHGTRRDGALFAMRGVTIMQIEGDRVVAHRFYMEPVEQGGADVLTSITQAMT